MKSISFVAGALAGATTLALIAAPALAQPVPPNTYDWTGVYVGLNAGWNGDNTKANPSTATVNQLSGVNDGTSAVTVPPTSFTTAPMDYHGSGGAGGGQVGFNRQTGHIVWGLEGDMDSVGGRAQQFSSYGLPATALTTGSTVSIDRFTDPQWTASIRGRLGYAMGRALFYGTGGLAIADVRQAAFYGYAPTVTSAVAAANPGASFGPYSGFSGAENTLTGWTLGGGAEFAVGHGVSIGAEYRHSDYGSPRYALGSAGPDSVSESPQLGYTDDQVLAKVNFKFGNGVF